MAEYDAAGTLQRRWVHGPGVDEPLVAYEGTTTASKNWLYADHLGSIVAAADATGTNTAIYSYGPYGEPNTTTGQRFRYTGQQLIGGLDLYDYKARFYDPKLGRFLQTDPIGTQDDMNLYAYVGGNPVNATDPSGMVAAQAKLMVSQYGPGAAEFALSFIPGYDLYSAATNSNATRWDYAAGIAGIIPGAGKGVGFGVKAAGKIDDVARAAKGAAPLNLSPIGAGRSGAFNEAKRQAGIPTSQQPSRFLSNIDKRGNAQPGRIYEYEVPAPGGGTKTVRIRDDAGGHNFGPGDAQNRGPHFNDPSGNHYDY